MIIYADVLIVLNAYVDYILILSTEKIFKSNIKLHRRILGAFVGSLTSLMIFVPIKSELISISVGIVSTVIISLICFGFKSIRLMIKACVVMYLLSCTYCGIMFLLWRITQNSSIVINNNVVYFDISPLFLIISTVICYVIVTFVSKLILRRQAISTCMLDITFGCVSVNLRGMIDTGNTLHDSLSGLPVIIIDKISGISIVGTDLNSADADTLLTLDLNGFRYIPCSSVAGSGCLPAFRPDSIILCMNGEYSFISAYIAVSDSTFADGFNAIVGAQTITDKETLLCC